MEELINVGLSKSEIDMYFKYVGVIQENNNKNEQEVVFAVMSEKVRTACQLIESGLVEDNKIAEMTELSLTDVNAIRG